MSKKTQTLRELLVSLEGVSEESFNAKIREQLAASQEKILQQMYVPPSVLRGAAHDEVYLTTLKSRQRDEGFLHIVGSSRRSGFEPLELPAPAWKPRADAKWRVEFGKDRVTPGEAIHDEVHFARVDGTSLSQEALEELREEFRNATKYDLSRVYYPDPGGNPFYSEVLGEPFDYRKAELEALEAIRAGKHVGGIDTGRMLSSFTPPMHRIPPDNKGRAMSSNKEPPSPDAEQLPHVSVGGGEYTSANISEMHTYHLINAVRKRRRESGALPAAYSWMLDEVDRRGLREVCDSHRGSLHAQASGTLYSTIQGVRLDAIRKREQALRLYAVSSLQNLAESADIPRKDLFRSREEFQAELLAAEFPLLDVDWERFIFLHDHMLDGTSTRISSRYVDTTDTRLAQIVRRLFAKDADALEDEYSVHWALETYLRRGLHRDGSALCPEIPEKHLPLVQQLEDKMTDINSPQKGDPSTKFLEVPLDDLVKVHKEEGKKNLFQKLAAMKEVVLSPRNPVKDKVFAHKVTFTSVQGDNEAEALRALTHAPWSLIDDYLRRLGGFSVLTGHGDSCRTLLSQLKRLEHQGTPFTIELPVTAAYFNREKDMTESTENAMSLEEQLAAHEEEVARLKAELNAQKGIMGHPTAVMMKDGIFDGTKMVAATEAVDAINALARKIALKFFVPEGHESILDTEQGQMFIDMAMPMALHIAATNGLFGQGSEFVGATASYAFKGNWFKHGKVMTTKVKEVVAEFSGEMGQIVELGKVLMGVGEADGASMLAEVTDFAESVGTMSAKETVDAQRKA